MKLEAAGDIYIWYNYINPDKTVEIVNFLKTEVEKGNQVFYNIYTEEEMQRDKEKRNTGIFFFRGKENEKNSNSECWWRIYVCWSYAR